jgi:outer membrane receptor protein involved in Fe transport
MQAAKQRDSLPRDTTILAPIEVISSIAPAAGTRVGSGVPGRLATLSRPEIIAWGPRTLADALGGRAGVSVYDDLGSPSKLNLSTRGFNVGPVVGLPPGVSVFLDGVRQNEPDAAQVNFDLLPLQHVKRIELLSGAGALLGPNSLGGAINLITRRGESPFEAEVELSGGSFGAYGAAGSVAGVSRAGDYYVAAEYQRAEGWRRATRAESYSAFTNLGRLGPERGVRFQAFGATSYAETAGSLPGSVFATAPRTNFTAGDFEDLDLLQIGLSGYAPIGPGRGSASFWYRRHNAERFNVNQAPDPDARGFSENRTFGGNAEWQWAPAVGRPTLVLRAGIDGAASSVDVRLREEGQAVPERTLTTDVHSPSWDLAGYATADFAVGPATLSAGFRFDYIEVRFEPKVLGEQPAEAGDSATHLFRRLSPRGGVRFQLSPGISAYASLGQSFRAPAILELACADEGAPCPLPFALGDDPPLEPVVATTYELGARWTRGTLSLDAAVYRTDVRDDIGFIASEQALLSGYFANIGGTRREGIELSAEARLRDGHTMYVGYALTRASFRTEAEVFSIRSDHDFAPGGPSPSPLFGANEVAVGDRLPLAPEHQIRLGAALVLGAGLEAGVDGRHTGSQWLRGDEANETEPLDGYFTVDVRLSWERRAWSVAAIVTNALDARKPTFGTFNLNRSTGELERFLTPLNARGLRLVVRRGFGSGS